MDASHHTSIIGRRGVEITKIRQDHDVQIQFPEKGSDRPNTIIITGLEKDSHAAKESILKKVSDLVRTLYLSSTELKSSGRSTFITYKVVIDSLLLSKDYSDLLVMS